MAKAASRMVIGRLPPPRSTMRPESLRPRPDRLMIDTMMPAVAQVAAMPTQPLPPSTSAATMRSVGRDRACDPRNACAQK